MKIKDMKINEGKTVNLPTDAPDTFKHGGKTFKKGSASYSEDNNAKEYKNGTLTTYKEKSKIVALYLELAAGVEGKDGIWYVLDTSVNESRLPMFESY
jgi:hypothetical protein